MSAVPSLRAPFPWFGGKSRAASLVWDALGDVVNYVEPFAGSLAVLLARPHPPHTETVNDASKFLANFWRALALNPDAVADACDWPVNETDLHARHRWLVARLPELAALLDSDPEAHDAKVAGWWVWGLSAWIGDGWCDEDGKGCGAQVRHLSTAGQGIHRKIPHLGNAGRGVHRGHREHLRAYLGALSVRLRGVRVACGDWSRVCTDSVTWRHGVTGVFLDPPYAEGAQQYAAGGTGTGLSADVRAWAIEAGKRRDMRVVLSGYAGEHDALESRGWRVVEWRSGGAGYMAAGADRTASRERLWLSPHCEGARQLSLLGGAS